MSNVATLQHQPFVEVRTDDTGALDELIAEGVSIHVEQLADNQWWIGIERGDEMQRLVFTSRSNITAFTESE